MTLMKTTMPRNAKLIVNEYAALIRKAEAEWDTEEVARLLLERNKKLGG